MSKSTIFNAMKKRGELLTLIFVTVASILIAVASFVGANSIDKNIDYIGDSRINIVYKTSLCLGEIKEIPRENRVAFDSLKSAINEGFYYSEECP